ncbi:Lon protease [Sporotomaculum syntrophicum]|uniref:endopeptidase La n=1 Tax=Sporotomaculum syntrophicum TaxID=182264 RepID=A0A9D3AYD8_9FIRM|nr:ATP-binding protein [Sporotomaculum syntrophicum]KAF1085331.1 Lon protease [Sporotomaculum syntrophicum]
MSKEEKNQIELLPIMELGLEQLRFSCKEEYLDFETTATVAPLEGMIGQERAVKAMEFGLHTKKPGYNIFVSGMVGTGKLTYAKQVVHKLAKGQPVPRDWCYVNNFEDSSQPIAISLPAGTGEAFRQDMKELLDNLRNDLPEALSSEDFERKRAAIRKAFQEQQIAKQEALAEKAKALSITIRWSNTGYMLVPLLNGEPVSEEEFDKLDEEQKEIIKANLQAVQELTIAEVRQAQLEEREAKDKIRALVKKVALFVVGNLIEELQEKYRDNPEVIKYLEALKQDVVKNVKDFKRTSSSEEQGQMVMFGKTTREKVEERHAINLLVNNRNCEGAPVIVETNPNYYNLCGRVEYSSRMGVVSTDFTMIKAGAFHLANGGYLIVNAKDVLMNPGVWEAMKRTLKTKKLSIESLGEQYGLIAMASLKPQAIPVDVKVIMLGSPYLYHLMYQYDEDFRKLFKIHADFDVQMDNTSDNIGKLAAFISATVKKEKLREFTRAAVARVIEYTSRLSGSQTKFTARFNQIVDIIYEADSWAAMEGAAIIDADHVRQAIAEKRYRANIYEERIQEMFKEGIYLIDTDGAKVGQVNGLAVMGAGEYAFGKPSRITANTYLGREGVINIERETRMSGASHSKGVLILSSYLGHKYAQNTPLSVTASLTFEQLYDGVDGDSASSAELYAILSSLAELPLRQDLAVTGSVNQKGEIQPIGGVNEKIEGFFEVCKIKGLTGRQGVIIPSRNVKDLQLNEEVVAAVGEGKFHIYAITSVDEGIELLTGVAAGEAGRDDVYPAQSVHGRVIAKLRAYHEAYSDDQDDKDRQDASS